MALTIFDSDECVWAEMVFMYAGVPIGKIRKVRYSIESDDVELFAGGDEAIGIQSGNIKKNGSFTVLKGVLDSMQRAAVAAGGRYVTDLRADLVITYLAAVGRPVQVDTLTGAKISKMEKGWDQGATNMDCECPFKFLKLKST